MRFIQDLPEDEKITLLEYQKKHKKSHAHNRRHAILLSAEGKTTSFIAELFNVRTRTVYECGAARAVQSVGVEWHYGNYVEAWLWM